MCFHRPSRFRRWVAGTAPHTTPPAVVSVTADQTTSNTKGPSRRRKAGFGPGVRPLRESRSSTTARRKMARPNRDKKYGVRVPQQQQQQQQSSSTSGSSTRCYTMRSYGTSGVLVSSRVPAVGHTVDEGELGPLASTQLAPGRDPSLFWRALVGAGVVAVFVLAALTAYSGRPAETWQRKGGQRGRGSSLTKPTSFRNVGPPSMQTAAIVSRLTLKASNEYGEYNPAGLSLYGIEMVVEPHRETTLTTTASGNSKDSRFFWRVVEAGASGPPPAGEEKEEEEEDPVVVFDAEGGSEITVTLTSPGRAFLVTVEELRVDGTVLARGSATASCKYVRRELRDLTELDRTEFLDAVEAYFKTSAAEGLAKYGEGFSNYERLTAYHNSPRNIFCYHAGLQFLSAHCAFGLMMERSLQVVNPKVSLAFWDYMIEASTLGTEWGESGIFDDDMFGRAGGQSENDFQVTEGRFGGVATIYDPKDSLIDGRFATHHNAYGYIAATNNYQDVPLLTRTSSFCNLKTHATFATADVLVGCFDAHDTLTEWESCMEKKVHGDIHGLLGGAFHCNVDMQEFHEKHPQYSPGLLTFLLEFMTINFWPSNTFMPDFNECDTECARGQTEPCGCTCNVDALSMSDDEIYALTSGFLSKARNRYAGDTFVSYDESSDRPWGLAQDGVRFSDAEASLLLRHIVKIGCEPGAVGMMAGGASPMDPLFWVLHPMFEKALHVLWMSPKYRDAYSFAWTDGSCDGSKLDDPLPFTEKDLGMGKGTVLLTNSEIMSFLHASNPQLPYVYEKFDTWGTLNNWDFCPECVAPAATSSPSL